VQEHVKLYSAQLTTTFVEFKLVVFQFLGVFLSGKLEGKTKYHVINPAHFYGFICLSKVRDFAA
jgi:hypothetical protein